MRDPWPRSEHIVLLFSCRTLVGSDAGRSLSLRQAVWFLLARGTVAENGTNALAEKAQAQAVVCFCFLWFEGQTIYF